MAKKGGKISGRGIQNTDRPICQGHPDPIESKGPPPDLRQMHALNGWMDLRLRDGDAQ
jgi:hypothetical protein